MTEACAILVVEDDPAVRVLLTEALRFAGFDVRSAAHGRDALVVLERRRPRLILMDLDMPIMDGWAFREELCRRPGLAGIPVIVLSAARWDQGLIDGLGAVEFLQKPCDLDPLVATIRWAVGAGGTDGLEPFPALPRQEIASDAPTTESSARGEPGQ
jgi:DNA-binding response OmpR family regulator